MTGPLPALTSDVLTHLLADIREALTRRITGRIAVGRHRALRIRSAGSLLAILALVAVRADIPPRGVMSHAEFRRRLTVTSRRVRGGLCSHTTERDYQ